MALSKGESTPLRKETINRESLLSSEPVVSQRGDYRKQYDSAYDQSCVSECSSFLKRKRVFFTLPQTWNDM